MDKEEIFSGVSNNLFFCYKADIDAQGLVDPKDVQCMNIETGEVASFPHEEDEPKRTPWSQTFSAEIVMTEEQRKELMRLFPPTLWRTQVMSNPPQDSRPRSYIISSKESDKELDMIAINAYMYNRGDKTYVMEHCKIERKKREYRHSNPSRCEPTSKLKTQRLRGRRRETFPVSLKARLLRCIARSSIVGFSTGLTSSRSVSRAFKPKCLILIAALMSRS